MQPFRIRLATLLFLLFAYLFDGVYSCNYCQGIDHSDLAKHFFCFLIP